MCDTEVYTVRVDSVYNSSHVDFVGYINIPLRNVIKAELLSMSVAANTSVTPIIHVYVDELVSKMNDRTNLQYAIRTAGTISTEGPTPSSAVTNVAALSTCIASIPAEAVNERTVYGSNANFPTEVIFIEPIRQLTQLTIRLYKDTGRLVEDPTDKYTFMTFRFTCSKPNRCLYPDRGGVPLM